MRTFIAVEIDDRVKANILRLQGRLKDRLRLAQRAATWVRPEAMHLTIKFLGEVPDAQIMDICKTVEQVTSQREPFDLDVQGLGHFGGRSARVLWVGTGSGSEALADLHVDLENALADIGFGPEGRAFSSHLTLCRIKDYQAGLQVIEAYQAHQDLSFGASRVDTVTLYESRLSPQGPQYTPLGHYGLGQDG